MKTFNTIYSQVILTEMINRHRPFIAKYGETEESITRYEDIDPTPSKINVPKMLKMAHSGRFPELTTPDDFERVKEDGTTNPAGEFSWILSRIDSGEVEATPQGLAQAKAVLEAYHSAKKTKRWTGHKDINKYSTIQEIARHLAVAGADLDAEDNEAGSRTTKHPDLLLPGTELIWSGSREGKDWDVIRIYPNDLGLKAIQDYCSRFNTTYCVRGSSMFASYAKSTTEYGDPNLAGYFAFFRDGEIAGLFTAGREFKNGNNNTFSAEEAAEIRPIVVKALPTYFGILDKIIRQDGPQTGEAAEQERARVERFTNTVIKLIVDDNTFHTMLFKVYHILFSQAVKAKHLGSMPRVCSYEEVRNNRWVISVLNNSSHPTPREAVKAYCTNKILHHNKAPTVLISLIKKYYQGEYLATRNTLDITHAQKIVSRLSYGDKQIFPEIDEVARRSGIINTSGNVPPAYDDISPVISAQVDKIIDAVIDRLRSTISRGELIPESSVVQGIMDELNAWSNPSVSKNKIPPPETKISLNSIFNNVKM